MAIQLPGLAVLWTRPWNCKPWQLYGHFSEFGKSGHTTAEVSSSMDTALELQTLAVVWAPFEFKYYGGLSRVNGCMVVILGGLELDSISTVNSTVQLLAHRWASSPSVGYYPAH